MSNLIASVVAEPGCVSRFRLAEWDLLIRQARHSNLLARVHTHLQNHGQMTLVPEEAARHLNWASTLASRHADLVRLEIEEIHRALAPLGGPVVLLKGAAYLAAGLPAGRGRVFTDIDILVRRPDLERSEKALQKQGWATTHLNRYDQKYYRKWMHELPPMKHTVRKSLVDVHHGILPPTSRLSPSAEKLFSAIVPVAGWDGLYTLSREDMVLHSACHLFHDGEFEHGLRDLVDMDALLREFAREAGYWEKLVDRALDMDLIRPLFYALTYCRSLLDTPVPEQTLQRVRDEARVPSPVLDLMDNLLRRGLSPAHHSCEDRFTGLAHWLLYVRSHYLRMPFHLLLPHLAHQAFVVPINQRMAEREKTRTPTLQQLLARRARLPDEHRDP
jgi:hypothetical protein